MDRSFSRWLVLQVFVLIGLGLALGCKSAPKAEAPQTHPPTIESKPQPAERVDETAGFKQVEPADEGIVEEVDTATLVETLNAQGILETVHFDFDKYDLTSQAIRVLGENAAGIKAHPDFRVRVEGHCDERGTVEYNLALGEKRARSARDYLASLGVPAHRLTIISYGKERPRDPRHNETAWSMNRRDDFIFLAE